MDLWIASLQLRCIWDIFGLKTKQLCATKNHKMVKSPISRPFCSQWLQRPFSFLQPRLQNPLSFLQPLAAEWLKTAADSHIGCRNYIGCRKTAYLCTRILQRRALENKSKFQRYGTTYSTEQAAREKTNEWPSEALIRWIYALRAWSIRLWPWLSTNVWILAADSRRSYDSNFL